MAYNGELRELYNDLDKRITADSHERVTWRSALAQRLESQDHAEKEHRQYMHDSMHSLRNELVIMSGKLDNLPCKEHIVDFCWIKKNIWALWSGIVLLGSAITGVAVYFANLHMGK